MSWVGEKREVNTLTDKDRFDPRVSIDQPSDEGDDAIIWKDVSRALKEM